MWRLILKELGRGRAEARVAIFALSLAIGLLALVCTVVLGCYESLGSRLFVNLPADIVLVEPQNSSSLFFNILQQGKSSRGIAASRLPQLREMDEVIAVWPRLEVKVPMVASGGSAIFGSALSTDLFASGLPAELLAATGALPADFRDEAGAPVPIIISPLLLDMYNGTVAPALKALPLTIEELKGVAFTLTLGRSYMLGKRGQVGQERCYIAGKSPLATTLGFSVPLETAQRWLSTYAPGEAVEYSGIYLRLKSGTGYSAFRQKLLSMGLDYDALSRRAADLLTLLRFLLIAFGGSLLLLALLAISQAISRLAVRRKQAHFVFSCLGATLKQLRLLLFGQAAVLGLLGGLLGLLGAYLLLLFYGILVVPQVAVLDSLGLSGFSLSLPMVILFLLLSFFTALLAALPAAIKLKDFYENTKTH